MRNAPASHENWLLAGTEEPMLRETTIMDRYRDSQ